MLKPSLLAFATVAALAASAHAGAAMSPSANATGTTEFGPQHSPLGTPSVLYDQTGSPASNGAPDQDFEDAFNAYDSEGADDFEVTDSTGWTITGVNTVGTTGLAGGATVRVNFHSNSATDFPDAIECSYTGIVPADSAGSFTITLPTPCELGPGRHWVAIQTTQAFGSNGQHFWSNRSVQSNAESVWRNPGDGFGSGCTSWGRQQTECAVGGAAGPDFLFQIVGSVSPEPEQPTAELTPYRPVPATGSRVLLAMFALFLTAGFLVHRFNRH